jgi:hypothetical protein
MRRTSVGPLPTVQADISRTMLEQALSSSFPGTQLNGFRIEDAHHGFSTVLRVHLTPADSNPQLPPSVMLKGGFEEFTRSRGRDFTYRSLQMEYQAYLMLPELGLHMPKVFFQQLDPERAQMVILMEDLALRKVRFQRGLLPNDAGQVARRLTALAEFHARTWDSPELKEGGKYGAMASNGAQMFLDYLDHAGFDDNEYAKFIALPRCQAAPLVMQDYDWIKRYIAYAAAMSNAIPNCVIHGDTHLSNLYEESDGTPGFFDSLARREPGISEATYHICNALDPMQRRRHERDLVAHYRAQLIQHGVSMPSLWEVMHQYTTFLSLNLITFFVNPTYYQTEAFNTAHAVRAIMAIIDNNGYELGV